MNQHCQRRLSHRVCGQMTIEFMAIFPIVIIVACIAVNGIQFVSECAAFDVQAKNAVRAYAASPGFGDDAESVTAQIDDALSRQFSSEALSVSVDSSAISGEMVCYTARLDYAPNLFGFGFKDSVLGVALPHLKHHVSLVVDPYRPGMML
jgi:CBS domain containing-hemolysin-like protein